jgi:hypothetical protein
MMTARPNDFWPSRTRGNADDYDSHRPVKIPSVPSAASAITITIRGQGNRRPGPLGAVRDKSHRPETAPTAADDADDADAKAGLHFG